MCENKVGFHVPRGYGYREVFVRCGNTDPHGGRAICQECRKNRHTMRDIKNQEANIEADNAWARSANWGEY